MTMAPTSCWASRGTHDDEGEDPVAALPKDVSSRVLATSHSAPDVLRTVRACTAVDWRN